MEGISVLMSVYGKENPMCLREALQSIFNQTLLPNEVLLVEDGPLTPELDAVILSFKQRYSSLRVLAFPKNRGLGPALNDGVLHCNYDLIARMDSDDISKPNRLERQRQLFRSHPEVDVCSSWIEEFEDKTFNILFIRKLPETHEELYRWSMRRSPINHPSVMFRREAVLKAGNYQGLRFFEDYDLCVRLMLNGCKFYCLQESLLFFRYSQDMIKRRGGWGYALTELSFQYRLYRIHYIGFSTFLSNVLIRFPIRILPSFIRSYVYQFIRSKK